MSDRILEFPVHSGSMEPFIGKGDCIQVRVTTDVAVGDVVLILEPAPRVHRVVSKVDSAGEILVVTCGDNGGGPDPPAPMSRVLGRVITVNGRPVRKLPGSLWAWLTRWQAGSSRRRRIAHWLRRLLIRLAG